MAINIVDTSSAEGSQSSLETTKTSKPTQPKYVYHGNNLVPVNSNGKAQPGGTDNVAMEAEEST